MKLSTIRGDNRPLRIPTLLDGKVYAANAADSILFTLKASSEDPDSAALVQKALGYGITADDTGVSLELLYADVVDLTPGTLYVWDVQAQDANGVHTVRQGTLEVTADVTHGLVTAVPVHLMNPPIPAPGNPDNLFTATATVDLGSGRFVTIVPGGVAYADGPAGKRAHGFVREAYSAGRTAVVEKTGSLNGLTGLTPGTEYYLAALGLIATTPPAEGISQHLGTASAANVLEVTIADPVIL